MKKFKILFISSILALCLGACKKYLDIVPDNVATIDLAFSDRFNTEKFLATCYSYLPVFADPWINPGLLGGDEIWINEERDNPEATMIAKGFQSTSNPYLSYWDGNNRGKQLYIGIRNCNIFLENINNVMGIPESERKSWIAEITFLKAFYHFWLFQCYGPIPIVDENLPIYTSSEGIKVYRQPVDSCINYIIKTLDKAIPDLPMMVLSETTEMGRITRPIALAIKARALATAASPLFNGNTDYATLTDNRGIKLFNSTYDPNKWKLAAEAAKAAIDTCELVGIKLVDNYTTQNEYSPELKREFTLRSVVTERRSPEIIWSATNFRFSNNYQSMCQPLLISVTDANPVSMFYAPTLRMAELYYTKNGVPIEEDVKWDYTNRYSLQRATTEDNDFIKSGEQTAKLHFNRESRFYANIAFDRGTFVLEPTFYYVQTRAGELATKRNRAEFSATGYFLKKFLNPKNSFSNNSYASDYDFPFPIIRLADLYLLYAEALNEMKTAPDAEVYKYIDKVRERAGLKAVVESWQNYSSKPGKPAGKAGMRDIIQQERMIEMAFEGSRFWDLRRWKLASKYMNQPIKGWNISGAGTDFYHVTTLFNPSFGFRDYLWPIKESEIINNPNLVQNLGW